MLRFIAFMVVAVVLSRLLGWLPVVGPLFARTGFLGIWITALLLSWGFTKWGRRAVRVRRDRVNARQLQAVDSPHNHGKLGSLYLAQGRPRKALEELERAVAGEPEVAEWRYRQGSALLEVRRPEEAAEALRSAVGIDEEHAYGGAQLRLAEALAACGRHDEALEALAVFERNHGPSPESAYRRGAALSKLGRRDEARAAFDEVARLASNVVSYQRRDAELWKLRARLGALR